MNSKRILLGLLVLVLAAGAEGAAIGFHRAVERVELGVLLEGLRVDGRGLRVALALDLLGIAVRVGEDHLALALGVLTILVVLILPLPAIVLDLFLATKDALADMGIHLNLICEECSKRGRSAGVQGGADGLGNRRASGRFIISCLHKEWIWDRGEVQ